MLVFFRGSVASYSDSPRLEVVRRHMTKYIMESDGRIKSNWKNIIQNPLSSVQYPCWCWILSKWVQQLGHGVGEVLSSHQGARTYLISMLSWSSTLATPLIRFSPGRIWRPTHSTVASASPSTSCWGPCGLSTKQRTCQIRSGFQLE